MSFAVATDEVVTVQHLRIRVRVHGEGRPLLLLNGLGAPLELWDPLVGRLSGVRAIAFDAPGSGRSETPCLPLSIRAHARLAAGVLDAMGHPRADVLGLSFGGMVAQELARVSAGHVDRLVLASTSCGWGGVPSAAAAVSAVQTPARYYSRLPSGGGRARTPRSWAARGAAAWRTRPAAGATSTSCSPRPRGRACTTSREWPSRRWSWPAPTTHWFLR